MEMILKNIFCVPTIQVNIFALTRKEDIVSQNFMDPEGLILNSQQLPICSYPEPDQSSPHHPIPPLQDPS
jgi:hypothetical protein